uniref:Uncharacterized protein n=1 Tax=Oryza brachyantha TaxID=4533 RepID=J3LDN8_ORYBR
MLLFLLRCVGASRASRSSSPVVLGSVACGSLMSLGCGMTLTKCPGTRNTRYIHLKNMRKWSEIFVRLQCTQIGKCLQIKLTLVKWKHQII